MKIASLIARILLGLVFLVFGLNGFLNFLHGPLPPGDAGLFLTVMFRTHFVWFVAGVQVLAGALLLANRYVPLALVLSAALIANIFAFHATMEPRGAALAVVVAILWVLIASRYRAHLAPIFTARA